MTKLVAGLVLVGLLSNGAAQAQMQPQSQDATKQKTYVAMDTNGDDRITREEFMAEFIAQAESRYAQFLSRIDTNRDGIVTREEFFAAQPPQR